MKYMELLEKIKMLEEDGKEILVIVKNKNSKECNECNS